MNKRLFVGNLPYRIEETQLEELFSQAGDVESVSVMRETETGRGRGFAFVEMVSEEGAERAVSQFNRYSLEGRNLTVNEARPMAARPRAPNPPRRSESRW